MKNKYKCGEIEISLE